MPRTIPKARVLSRFSLAGGAALPSRSGDRGTSSPLASSFAGDRAPSRDARARAQMNAVKENEKSQKD